MTPAQENGWSLILGSIAAIPLFIIVHLATTVAVIFGISLSSALHGDQNDPLMYDLSVGASAIAGAIAGRWVLDRVLRNWVGWPIVVVVVVLCGLVILGTISQLNYSPWWRSVAAGAYAIISIFASWYVLMPRRVGDALWAP